MKQIVLVAIAVLSGLMLVATGCSTDDGNGGNSAENSQQPTSAQSTAPSGTEATQPESSTSEIPSEATSTTDEVPDSEESSPPDSGFPQTVVDDAGEVTLFDRPERIVSLSPTATEMLFAVGAGSQVVAADSFSNFPPEAPTTDLSGFQPNLEAISTYDPDLVIISFDPGDLASGLRAIGTEVIVYSAAPDLEGSFEQMLSLGLATGNAEQAQAAVEGLMDEIDVAVSNIVLPPEPLDYYLELDPSLFSASSSSFIGQVLATVGLASIADAAEGAAGGFPQLSEEFILDANPDFIFLTDCCGDTPETLSERPGWDNLDAVIGGRVIVFDADVISRWGPRIVELLTMAAMIVSNELALLG